MNGFYEASLLTQFMVVLLVIFLLIAFFGTLTTIIDKIAQVRTARWEALKAMDEEYSRGRRADEKARDDSIRKMFDARDDGL